MTGPIRHLAGLASILARRGHEVNVVTSNSDVPDSTPAEEEVNRVAIHRLRTEWRWGHWIRCPELRRFLKLNDYDLIHAQSYRNYFCETGAEIARTRQVPFVITPRGSLLGYRYIGATRFSWTPNIVFDLATRKRALRRATIVTTSSAETEDALRIGIPADRIRMIPHGLDLNFMPEFKPRSTGGERLLFVGRITGQRNLEFLLRGFYLATKTHPNLGLTVVGDPIPSKFSFSERHYNGRIRLLATKLNLDSRVRFVGGVYGSALWDYYLASDLFLYSAKYDNFGLALLEAAYFGLPIISTPVGIAPELGRLSGGVLLADHDDDQALSDAIHKASTDAEWRGQASRSLHQISKNFSIERNADAHEFLYESLIDSQGIAATGRIGS